MNKWSFLSMLPFYILIGIIFLILIFYKLWYVILFIISMFIVVYLASQWAKYCMNKEIEEKKVKGEHLYY